MKMSNLLSAFLLLLLILMFTCPIYAQFPRRQIMPNDTLQSIKLFDDGRVRFSIYAPNADSVRLASSDIPGNYQGANMQKMENGVWQTLLGPVQPGAFRYNFNVDGLSVIDPRNPSTSESNRNTWSLFCIPGSEFMDTRDVPHGAVSKVIYYSKSLERFRRMHVYTPPGYETNTETYPVFYLLHGASDCDNSWTTVGRASFILDNLIAAGKAKPMVVVMPAGHTRAIRRRGGGGSEQRIDEFKMDFLNDIIPYAESHYRIYKDFQNRAIAGLSMGGGQTLNVFEKFAHVGVFSSGVFELNPRNQNAGNESNWEAEKKEFLADDALKEKIKLIWFSTGNEDFLLETSRATVELFKKYDFDVIYNETEGGHTWINWRNYLNEFAPLLF